MIYQTYLASFPLASFRSSRIETLGTRVNASLLKHPPESNRLDARRRLSSKIDSLQASQQIKHVVGRQPSSSRHLYSIFTSIIRAPGVIDTSFQCPTRSVNLLVNLLVKFILLALERSVPLETRPNEVEFRRQCGGNDSVTPGHV